MVGAAFPALRMARVVVTHRMAALTPHTVHLMSNGSGHLPANVYQLPGASNQLKLEQLVCNPLDTELLGTPDTRDMPILGAHRSPRSFAVPGQFPQPAIFAGSRRVSPVIRRREKSKVPNAATNGGRVDGRNRLQGDRAVFPLL